MIRPDLWLAENTLCRIGLHLFREHRLTEKDGTLVIHYLFCPACHKTHIIYERKRIALIAANHSQAQLYAERMLNGYGPGPIPHPNKVFTMISTHDPYRVRGLRPDFAIVVGSAVEYPDDKLNQTLLNLQPSGCTILWGPSR